MAARYNLDEKSFQGLLSDAFVVQHSGMDTAFLASTVDLQRAIALGELDLDRGMNAVAERARGVAQASGTAIALLQGDQLIYRAGSGSGAANVGRHMTAALCGSVPTGSRAILQVENARTDARIEAAVCRQFEAESLLILPVFHAGILAGVLNVMFDAAHVFQPLEVRSYRLLATLLGEAMSYPAEREPASSQADLSSRRHVEWIRPLLEACPVAAAANQTMDPVREHAVAELAASSQSAGSAPERARRRSLRQGRLGETAAAVAAVLVIACWIGFSSRPPTPILAPSAQPSNELDPRTLAVPVQTVLANGTSDSLPQAAPQREERMKTTAKTHAASVMNGTTRVRYFSDDVTVRYFSPSNTPQRVMDRNAQVRQFSKDVTVRHFNAPVVPPAPLVEESSAQRVTR